MKSYAIVCDSSHAEVAGRLAHALAAQRGVMAGVMDLREFQAKQAAVCRHRFVIFIGGNPVSRPYIEDMDVHYLGCGVLWGTRDGAAAVWLGEKQRGTSRALWEALQTRIPGVSVPGTALGTYQSQNRQTRLSLLFQAFTAPFNRTVRDTLAYSVGVLAFLRDAIDPLKAAEKRVLLARG